MDIIDIRKELLRQNLEDDFQFHPKFYDDFSNLVIKSGEEEKVIKLLITRLFVIKELGNIDCGLKWLESLKSYKNMYSLHIDTHDKNYRLLFSKNAKGKYFLHMFCEKQGKKSTSYAKHVQIAIQRRDND